MYDYINFDFTILEFSAIVVHFSRALGEKMYCRYVELKSLKKSISVGSSDISV